MTSHALTPEQEQALSILLGAEKERVCDLCELRLRKAEAKDGALHMSMLDPSGMSEVIAETMAGLLDKTPDAKNYVEVVLLRPSDGQRYTVTVRRPDGKTAHELRQVAETALAEAREENTRLREQLKYADQLTIDSARVCLDASGDPSLTIWGPGMPGERASAFFSFSEEPDDDGAYAAVLLYRKRPEPAQAREMKTLADLYRELKLVIAAVTADRAAYAARAALEPRPPLRDEEKR